jgi:ABC-type histidine transport system ATPase subunit
MKALPDGSAKPEDQKQVERIRSKLAMVFQSFNLWSHRTILENVIEAPVHVLGVPKKEAIEKAEGLLAKVGIADKRNFYPNHLSGGQQQRVAIARALAMAPGILLCDEITSALDPELVGEVLGVVESLAQEGMTLLMVTHEMNFARKVSDRVVFMHQGLVHEMGAPDTLFVNPQTPELQQFLSSLQ